MIGLRFLRQIDQRLREVFSDRSHLPFGGVSVLLAGDLRQLPPIGDAALCNRSKKNDEEVNAGRLLYRLFDEWSFTWTTQMRQAGEENRLFREQLERLANGEFTMEDWNHWHQQSFSRMSVERQKEFEDNAVLLAAYKADLVEFNRSHLLKLGNPIHEVEARNNPQEAACPSQNENAERLPNVLYLSRGCKVMLTSNLWPDAKLGYKSFYIYISSILFVL